jgi:hypothetical protein
MGQRPHSPRTWVQSSEQTANILRPQTAVARIYEKIMEKPAFFRQPKKRAGVIARATATTRERREGYLWRRHGSYRLKRKQARVKRQTDSFCSMVPLRRGLLMFRTRNENLRLTLKARSKDMV